MPTIVDGVASSVAIDTAGEIVDLKGLDISSLVGAPANWEHESKLPSQIIGKIIEAHKIFSEEDCQNERHKYFWDKTKIPFLYCKVRLFDDEKNKKPSAVEVASLFKDDAAHPEEQPIVGFSIEGSKLNKSGPTVTHSIARKLTITCIPANKTCIAELVPEKERVLINPFAKELNFFKSEVKIPTSKNETNENIKESKQKAGKKIPTSKNETNENIKESKQKAGKKIPTSKNETNEGLEKALDAGSAMAAPGSLVQGAALGKESLEKRTKKVNSLTKSGWSEKADSAYKNWIEKGDFKKYMKKRMPHLADGEVDAIGRILALKKEMQKDESLSKMYSSYFRKSEDGKHDIEDLEKGFKENLLRNVAAGAASLLMASATPAHAVSGHLHQYIDGLKQKLEKIPGVKVNSQFKSLAGKSLNGVGAYTINVGPYTIRGDHRSLGPENTHHELTMTAPKDESKEDPSHKVTAKYLFNHLNKVSPKLLEMGSNVEIKKSENDSKKPKQEGIHISDEEGYIAHLPTRNKEGEVTSSLFVRPGGFLSADHNKAHKFKSAKEAREHIKQNQHKYKGQFNVNDFMITKDHRPKNTTYVDISEYDKDPIKDKFGKEHGNYYTDNKTGKPMTNEHGEPILPEFKIPKEFQPEKKIKKSELEKTTDIMMAAEKKDDDVCLPEEEFKEEHERLIDVLGHPTAKKLKEEKKKQEKEVKKKEILEKGAKGDWEKEGYKISHNKNEDNISITAHDKDGNYAGDFQFNSFNPINEKEKHTHLNPISINVDEPHQRKGLGNAMYSLAEKITGLKVHKSNRQTEAGKAFWEQPNRPFGKSEIKKKENFEVLMKAPNVRDVFSYVQTPYHPKEEGDYVKTKIHKPSGNRIHIVHSKGKDGEHKRSIYYMTDNGKHTGNVISRIELDHNLPSETGISSRITHAKTEKEYRGKNLNPLLYISALKDFGEIESDTMLSPGSQKTYEKLSKHPNIKVKFGQTNDPNSSHILKWKPRLKKSEKVVFDKNIANK